MEEWLNYKTKLGKALTQVYPLSRKNKPGRTKMGNKARTMGIRKRNIPTCQCLQKRTELQQEIARRNKNQAESETPPTSADPTSMETSNKINQGTR